MASKKKGPAGEKSAGKKTDRASSRARRERQSNGKARRTPSVMPAPSPTAPLPGAAESYRTITLTVQPDGVAIATIDLKSASVNTLTPELGEDLATVLNRVEADAQISALVFESGKPNGFIAGANIELIQQIHLASEAESMARDLSERVMLRIKRCTKPIVCAVHGSALGGGFELALSCREIVASDSKSTRLGLPEVQLGLLPGALGLLHVFERANAQTALDLGLTGRQLRARSALKLGLVDEVCPAPVLRQAAIARAANLARSGATSEKKSRGGWLDRKSLERAALEKNPAGRALLFRKAREQTRKKTRGLYPATERIIDIIEMHAKKGFSAAAELTYKAFGELVVSDTSRRLVEIFFATTALKKDTGVDEDVGELPPTERIGVLGAGLMGAGIAYVSANAGVTVRLRDKDDAGLGAGLRYVRGIVDERVNKRRMTGLERDHLMAQITGTTDTSGFANVDVVIEAVFEDLALKHKVLREIEAVTGPDTIFASNTSSIPITKIAAASKRPELVIGMHYFSPVHKMPLLEVIRTDKSAPEAVARAVALGKKQGKTVIVVRDGVGFYTSRILGPYMNEAAMLLCEGASVEAIDGALLDWGWPVGAITLLDEVGIDVAAHVGPIMFEAFGARMAPPEAMAKLVADGRKGRKNEKGFYLYGKAKGRKKGKVVDTSVYDLIGVTPKKKFDREAIQMRCSLQMVNEAIHCLGEEIIRSPRDGDIGAIFGLGFPPLRGGPFRYVDAVGASEVLRRIEGYRDQHGVRFTPAPLLVDMAKANKRFYTD